MVGTWLLGKKGKCTPKGAPDKGTSIRSCGPGAYEIFPSSRQFVFGISLSSAEITNIQHTA